MSAEPKHCQPHSVAEPCAACNTPRAADAEAIARLRFEVETACDLYGEKHPALDNTLLRVSPNDLRALLDAHDSWRSQRDEVHAEMERQTAMKLAERQERLAVMRAHEEALDALALTIDPKAGFTSTLKRVEEVLAKRRQEPQRQVD